MSIIIPTGCYTIIPAGSVVPNPANFTSYDVQAVLTGVNVVLGGPYCSCPLCPPPGCYVLTLCGDPSIQYTLSDNSGTAGSLGQFYNQVIQCTIPSALSGLGYDYTSTFTVTTNPTGTCTTSYDLQIVTPAYLNCNDANPCLMFRSCDNSTNTYNIITQDPIIRNHFDNCRTSCPNCTAGIRLTVGGTELDGCYTITKDCRGITSVNLDQYTGTFSYTLFCNIGNTTCEACNSECYKAELCNDQYIILQNPTVLGGGPVLTGLFNASIPLAEGVLFSGCMTITALPNCSGSNPSPVTGAEIEYIDTFTTCEECLTIPDPVSYRITRCDDPGIFIIVNTNLYSLVGRVINGVVLGNCSNLYPCNSVKPDQCWIVSYNDPTDTNIELESYKDTFPTCESCNKPKPC